MSHTPNQRWPESVVLRAMLIQQRGGYTDEETAEHMRDEGHHVPRKTIEGWRTKRARAAVVGEGQSCP